MNQRYLWQKNILASSLLYVSILSTGYIGLIVTTEAKSEQDVSMKLVGIEKESLPTKSNYIRNGIEENENGEFACTDIFAVQTVMDKDITIKKQEEQRRQEEEAKRLEEQRKHQASILASSASSETSTAYSGRFRLSIGNNDSDEVIVTKINNNFAGYPVEGLGQTILDVAKTYNIDPYFIAAVTWEESGRGVYLSNSYNLHGRKAVGGGWMAFDSFADCLWNFGDYIVKYYINYGYSSIETIQNKYCPNQGWANKIKRHMAVLQS